jgi:hypothetical protein
MGGRSHKTLDANAQNTPTSSKNGYSAPEGIPTRFFLPLIAQLCGRRVISALDHRSGYKPCVLDGVTIVRIIAPKVVLGRGTV